MTIQLTVLGSGDAFNSHGRGNSCYLVKDQEGAFCIDFGPTALMALKKIGFDTEKIDALFLTHLHGDHFAGLPMLFMDAQYCSSRRRPLVLGGPIGLKKRVEAWHKLAFGKEGKNRSFEIRYVEWAPGVVELVAGRHIQTFRARHMDVRDGALQIKVRTGMTSIGFTGDTSWTDDLIDLARGTELLVCDCMEDRDARSNHLSWETLVPRLHLLESKRILLSHFGWAMGAKVNQLAAPRVTFAEDGMVIRLPGRSSRRRELPR